MLSAIFGGLTAVGKLSDLISTVTSKIADARIAAINAKTEEERIAANERVKSLELQRDVMLKSLESKTSLQEAEAKVSSLNIIVRTFFALPIGLLIWKIFVWDKALGQWTQGRTDALDVNLWNVVTVVLGFYFLYEGATVLTRLWKK